MPVHVVRRRRKQRISDELSSDKPTKSEIESRMKTIKSAFERDDSDHKRCMTPEQIDISLDSILDQDSGRRAKQLSKSPKVETSFIIDETP